MARRTKIVCTLGPAVDSPDKIRALVRAGMNVARLNCSHGDWETKRRWIEWVREASPEIGPVAILADLQGPKFRVGEMPPEGVELVTGTTVEVGPGRTVPVDQEEILRAMAPKARLLLGDGEIELTIESGKFPDFRARVEVGGVLKGRKGVTLKNKVFDVPAITDKDHDDLRHAIEAGVDFVALSYVRSGDDLIGLRQLVRSLGGDVGLCAKIETDAATKHLDGILAHSDVVMVARGDMGLQMDFDDVPLQQKKIIEMANARGVPVITATQMLESMIVNRRPTRAEASDVYNAILDGTDAVMLSGETAAGAFPIECVEAMARIAEKAETEFARDQEREAPKEPASVSEAIAHSAAEVARLVRARAIVANTTSGSTARLVSKYRPQPPILCATWVESTWRRMALVWGVHAVLVNRPTDTDDAVSSSIEAFVRLKRLRSKDVVVVTAGTPVGEPGRTNLVQVQGVR